MSCLHLWKMNTISREQWANPELPQRELHHCQCLHRGRGIWRRNWGCTEGGTGDKQWIWERRGALPREQRSERLQHSEGIICSHSKGKWWGRREAWLTTSSSAGCPSGSESGHVGSLFPIIVRAKGVYPVCLGSSSTGTLCSPAGTHLQLQA